MPNTPNHEYNVPNQGAQDWHVPLNENFEDYDTDIELRDTDSNKSNYDPKQGAKFLATDTGVVYTGDGSSWVPSYALPRYDAPTNGGGRAGNVLQGHPVNEVQSGADGATIAGGGRDDGNSPYPNVVDGMYGTVGGGKGNTAGTYGTVSGGNRSEATGDYSTVAGGVFNQATASHASALGGWGNDANGDSSTVAGGAFNIAEGEKATIAGGGNTVKNDQDTSNFVYDDFGTVGGGGNNQAGTDDGDTTTATQATVGGGKGNTASNQGATVAGGESNTASGSNAAVGGGSDNDATDVASTVVGGYDNEASGQYTTVGGGRVNTASGHQSMIPGGANNVASGNYSFAAGVGAGATNNNAFVWHTGQNYHNLPGKSSDGLSSDKAVNGEPVTGADTFTVGAPGGVRFVTGSSSVTYISSGSTGWSTASTRTVKTNISPVEPETALEGVDSLEVATWEYEDDDGEGAGTTHIGPMAEEFHEAFDVGDSDEHINSINADGVALAAIQGLSEKVDEKNEQIEDLESTVTDYESTVDDLESTVEQQRAEIETLRAELDDLRSVVSENGTDED